MLFRWYSGITSGTTAAVIYPTGDDLCDVQCAVLQMADALDAMTMDRPYRDALSREEVIREIERGRNSQFHPEAVDSVLRLIREKKLP